MGFFDVFFGFKLKLKVTKYPSAVLFYILLLEIAPRFKIFKKSLMNKKCLQNGP